MNETFETIDNSATTPLEIWIEPWADSLVLPPGQQLTIAGSSELPGRFEIERTAERVVIYAWEGSTAVVRNGETVVQSYDIPVPGLPAGMSMKGFVAMMFGEPAAETRRAASPRPWWRFW